MAVLRDKLMPDQRPLHRLRVVLEMIKFEHTIFALPFALISLLLAYRLSSASTLPPVGRTLFWVLVAMVGARSASMAFNRIVDAKFDAMNPRTAIRAIPRGTVSIQYAVGFTLVASALLVLAAGMLNPLCLMLSPVALALTLGYSYTKRFTPFSHVVLGLAIGAAPVGAWLAVTGKFDIVPLLLCGIVLLWIGGFDIIYSLQDAEFDRKNGLRSIPAKLGGARALMVSRTFHLLMVGLLLLLGVTAHMGALYFVGAGITAALIIYEQSIVSATDLSRVNLAFFTLNGWVSVSLFIFTALDVATR